MKIIYTKKGEEIFVDDEDYDFLNNYIWHKDKYGYALTAIEDDNGKKYKKCSMHRMIFKLNDSNIMVDHINGITYDNTKTNLRICSNSENVKNRRKTHGKTTSIFKGVSFNKSKKLWVAYIENNSEHIDIGCFTNEIACANAYNHYAKKLHSEFARINQVPYMDIEEWETYMKKKPMTSVYKGIHYETSRNKWIAKIKNQSSGKVEFLGRFNTEEEARLSYDKRAIEIESGK